MEKNTEYVRMMDLAINRELDENPAKISKVLTALGIHFTYSAEMNEFYLSCPKCKTNIVARGNCTWGCKSNCQKEVFNNLIGLVRLFNGMNIRDGRNLAFDTVFADRGKTDLSMPIRLEGNDKGANLEQIPPRLIFWTIVNCQNNKAFTEIERGQFREYLFRQTAPSNKKEFIPPKQETAKTINSFHRPAFRSKETQRL